MADESVLAVPELGRLQYNLKHYLAYAKKIQKKASQLNKLGKRLEMNHCLTILQFPTHRSTAS